MAGKGQPLPKFGDWDVNDPASADGYTVIFNKARDERTSTTDTAAQGGTDSHKNQNDASKSTPNSSTNDCKKWFCCFGGSSTES